MTEIEEERLWTWWNGEGEVMKTGRLNLNNDKECRERIKKAVHVLGDIYFQFDNRDALESFASLRRAMGDVKIVSIKNHDLWRWFNSRED